MNIFMNNNKLSIYNAFPTHNTQGLLTVEYKNKQDIPTESGLTNNNKGIDYEL